MRKLVAVALLAACNFTPKYQRPVAPIAKMDGSSFEDQGWRATFSDARLQALIGLALKNNRDLRIAALEVEATRAQYRIERAALVPTVGATAVGAIDNRTEQPNQYRVGLTASYEIDLFGRVRSLKEAALEEYLASEEAHRAAHLSLVGEVAAQYLRERAYEEERVVAEQQLANNQQFFTLTQRMLEAGTRSELDVRTAEAQVFASRAEVARLKRQHLQAVNLLTQLVGEPLPTNLPPPQPLDAEVIADLPAGVSSEVLLRRPDVLAAEHTLRSANANIGAARAAFFPTISLTGFAGLSSAALTGLFSGGFAWTFAPQVTVPLFTGGKNEANLDLAHVRKKIEVARYERTIQVAFREVADGLVSRAFFDEQVAADQARVDADLKRYALSKQRYETGIENYLSVIISQQDLYLAQQLLIEARLSRLQNLSDLYRALGGGWRE
jgi:multidrug efflux system outer membrane protein